MWALSGLYLCYYVWGVATGAFHSIADLLASWPVDWAPFFLLSRSVLGRAWNGDRRGCFPNRPAALGRAAGLVAAFFLSVAFLHVRDSHYGTTDVLMTFLIMLSIAFLIEAHLDGKRSRFALAGAIGGLAAATKYNALLLPIAMVVSQLLTRSNRPITGCERHSIAVCCGSGALRTRVPHRRAIRAPRFPSLCRLHTGAARFDGGRYPGARAGQRLGPSSRVLAAVRRRTSPPSGRRDGRRRPAGLRAGGLGCFCCRFPSRTYLVAGAIRNLFFRTQSPVVPFLCLTAAYLVCLGARRLIAAYPSLAAGAPWRLAGLTTAVSRCDCVAFGPQRRAVRSRDQPDR